MQSPHQCNCDGCRIKSLENELDGTKFLLDLTTKELNETLDALDRLTQGIAECVRLVDEQQKA